MHIVGNSMTFPFYFRIILPLFLSFLCVRHAIFFQVSISVHVNELSVRDSKIIHVKYVTSRGLIMQNKQKLFALTNMKGQKEKKNIALHLISVFSYQFHLNTKQICPLFFIWKYPRNFLSRIIVFLFEANDHDPVWKSSKSNYRIFLSKYQMEKSYFSTHKKWHRSWDRYMEWKLVRRDATTALWEVVYRILFVLAGTRTSDAISDGESVERAVGTRINRNMFYIYMYVCYLISLEQQM